MTDRDKEKQAGERNKYRDNKIKMEKTDKQNEKWGLREREKKTERNRGGKCTKKQTNSKAKEGLGEGREKKKEKRGREEEEGKREEREEEGRRGRERRRRREKEKEKR